MRGGTAAETAEGENVEGEREMLDGKEEDVQRRMVSQKLFEPNITSVAALVNEYSRKRVNQPDAMGFRDGAGIRSLESGAWLCGTIY